MTTLEVELNRLRGIRERYAAVSGSIEQFRDIAVSCGRSIGEARVAELMEPENNRHAEVEARCKKLDAQRHASQVEIDKLTPELTALSAAIQRIEGELAGKVHERRVEEQRMIQDSYQAVARRLIEAASLLSAVSLEAKNIFTAASFEYQSEQSYDGQDDVLRNAGLREIWPNEFTEDYGHGTRRDAIVSNVYDWRRGAVSEADPVAISKRNQEDYLLKRYAEVDRERRLRMNPTAADKENARLAAVARGEEWYRVEVRSPTYRS